MGEVMRPGDPVLGQVCPRCGQESVVYNGNYFCSTYACWVMTRDVPRITRAYLLQCYKIAEDRGDAADMQRLTGYLTKYIDIDKKKEALVPEALKVTKTATIEIARGNVGKMTAGALANLVGQVPEKSEVRVTHYAGDQREPGYTNLTFTWTD